MPVVRAHSASSANAPGQAGLTEIKVGLVGKGIQKSRTPAMHEAEGAALGLSYSYRLFDTSVMPAGEADLAHILNLAEREGYAGLNVTYPYKVEVMSFLDEVSEAVASVGAVNTVVFRNGRRSGHNTDLWGFAESFERNMADVRKETVLLIGAGGAGGAVAHALAQCGVGRIEIADIDTEKAEALAKGVCGRHGAGAAASASIETAAPGADGVVNATPVGMASLPGCPLPEDLFRQDLWVADIVYFPLETELLRQARLRGCRTLEGAGMAVFQAVRAFEHFTGLRPDISRMEATFRSFDRPDG